MKDIIENFIESYEQDIKSIKESLEKSDFKTMEKQVHKLAGTISTFHADIPFNIAKNWSKMLMKWQEQVQQGSGNTGTSLLQMRTNWSRLKELVRR